MPRSQSSVIEQAQRIRHAILQRHGYSAEQDVPRADQSSGIEQATSLARVSAHWGITSDLAIVGGLVVLVRRAMRIGLRWYINPIVEQQNAFNDAAVQALYELRAENDALRARLAELIEDD